MQYEKDRRLHEENLEGSYEQLLTQEHTADVILTAENDQLKDSLAEFVSAAVTSTNNETFSAQTPSLATGISVDTNILRCEQQKSSKHLRSLQMVHGDINSTSNLRNPGLTGKLVFPSSRKM